MKYIYTPVPFVEIAKGLENGELKAKDIFFETKNFNGVRLLADTKLDLEDCIKVNFYLKEEINKPMREIDVIRKRPRRRT